MLEIVIALIFKKYRSVFVAGSYSKNRQYDRVSSKVMQVKNTKSVAIAA
jgi:hypothetical protein